jgi:hypothetical protein
VAAVIWALYAFFTGRLGGQAFEDKPWAGLVIAFGASGAISAAIEVARRSLPGALLPSGRRRARLTAGWRTVRLGSGCANGGCGRSARTSGPQAVEVQGADGVEFGLGAGGLPFAGACGIQAPALSRALCRDWM